MVQHHPVHLTGCDDGQDTIWCTGMAIGTLDVPHGHHFRWNGLGFWENLPHGDFDVREKTYLERDWEVVDVQVLTNYVIY